MAEKQSKKTAVLPWGMDKETLQPNSVKGISQSKIKAFNVGRMNPLKKPSNFLKKKEEKEEKKKLEAKETADAFEEFVAAFEETGTTGKTFVRGSMSIKPAATGDESIPNPSSGSVYKPKSKFSQKLEEKKEEKLFSAPVSTTKKPEKPSKKKASDKKKSILELFREELKRNQDQRKERRAIREIGKVAQEEPPPVQQEEFFNVDEYKEMSGKGSFDTGDPLTTNLYVGNINPKMNEENLCQLFGKFGPLASVKVMWPRTEEEKARNKNCGFVAYMKREDAEKALDHFKGTTIMDYEIQIGWGKAVRVPPQPVYVAPDKQEEENAKILDPPSGLPFNAQPHKSLPKSSSSSGGDDGGYMSVPPPENNLEKEASSLDKGENEDQKGSKNFDNVLYNAIVKVIIPTDLELLRVIHRMIEFVIREGPMFEAMIMNKEMNNSKFQFLFDNRSPAHIYYRWKLFSILQGDSPETWRVEEFRMFEGGSLWKPPPLKYFKSKIAPPIEEDIVRRGQLSTRQRDELEDQLRHLSMEREKIKKSMVWCLDHSESAEEILECIYESLCITETPLPTKISRLYLVSDILLNCSSAVPNSSNFRRGFEGKLMSIIEHFHSVMNSITSRIRTEQFKRRVLSCLRAWDQMSVYHYNVVDKLRLTFIGKTTEEIEKQKAFETVAALIGVNEGGGVGEGDAVDENLDGVPLVDNRPIDFSGGNELDGEPMENIDGESFPDPSIDGEPIGKSGNDDIDGVPMVSEVEDPVSRPAAFAPVVEVKSKWELVDYGEDSDESENGEKAGTSGTAEDLAKQQRQQLLAEIDERKRKILREVEVKAMELYDALESSGSYKREEITDRVDKYREKLMKEAVEPKGRSFSVKDSSRTRSRSPSPSTLEKYRLDDSPEVSSKKKKRKSISPRRSRSRSHERKRSKSPVAERRKSRSKSPVARKDSSSRSKWSRSRSRSPKKRRSKSRSKSPKRRSRSPIKRSRSQSKSPKRRRSRSPIRKRSHSRSPGKSSSRRRSRSPRHNRRRSKTPKSRHRSRSRSPSSKSSKKNKKRSRSRSKSPHKSKSKRSKY